MQLDGTSVAEIALAAGAAAALVLVVRARHRNKRRHDDQYARQHVCEHLREALERLLGEGRAVRRVGQAAPELPLEIHLSPGFDPQCVYDLLKLAEPVFVSERGVLYCREDWCELHPQ